MWASWPWFLQLWLPHTLVEAVKCEVPFSLLRLQSLFSSVAQRAGETTEADWSRYRLYWEFMSCDYGGWIQGRMWGIKAHRVTFSQVCVCNQIRSINNERVMFPDQHNILSVFVNCRRGGVCIVYTATSSSAAIFRCDFSQASCFISLPVIQTFSFR